MDFFGIKKKLEEGFGSLTGNIGNLFNRGVSTVGGVANNVLQQARPAAQQASQQWSNLQSTGNTLRQQAQNLTNDAINATTRDIGNFDLADSISSRAQDLGYSKRDQFSDLNKFRGGDLSALANPLLKAGNQGLDFQKGINQAPWQVAANLPRAAAATSTLVNMAQEPVNRVLRGDDEARAIREQQDLSVKGLYSAGDEISKFGTNLPWTKQSDPDSAVSKGGKIVGDIGLSIVGGAPSKAVSIPYYLTQAQGRVAGDVQKKTGDLNKAAIAGSVYAPVETALERFSVGKVLDGGGNLASRFARGYVSEGGTEAAQQFAENLTKNKVADPTQSLTEGVAESGLIGGLVGGGVSGLNSSRPASTDFTKQLDRELDGLNSAIMPPAQAPNISEQPQVNAPEQINTQPQAPVAPQVPQAPVQPVQPVQQPQVTQPTVMSEADTQQLQNTQREITRSQPLSGQPESISQLLQNKQIPQENVANQQALGEAKVQAQDLANLYKMDPATAQRLIENYGYANVAALAQEVSKSGTARSVDAVVVSEAVKRWGKPRSQMTDAELASLDQTPEAQQANTVATQPTQTAPQEQQPLLDPEAQSYVANQQENATEGRRDTPIQSDADLQKIIYGEEKIGANRDNLKVSQIVSPDYYARTYVTRPIERGVNKVIGAAQESGIPGVVGVGRVFQGFSREAGVSPELLQQKRLMQGGAEYGQIIGADFTATGKDISSESSSRIWATIDKPRGKKLKLDTNEANLTQDERIEREKIINVIDYITNYNLEHGFITPEQASNPNYITRMYSPFEESSVYNGAERSTKDSLLKQFKKRDEQVSEELLSQEIKDPYYIVGKKIAQSYQAGAVVDYFNALDASGQVSLTPKRGYVKLGQSKIYGEAKGKYVPKGIAEDINGFQYNMGVMNGFNDMITAYDQWGVRRGKKAALTILNPAVRLGNQVTNRAMFSNMGGINPIQFNAEYMKIGSQIANRSPYYIEAVRNGLIGTDIMSGQLKGSLEQYGVEPNVAQQAYRWLKKSYSSADDKARITAYKIYRERGYSEAEAANMTQRSFQDYKSVGFFYDIAAKTPIIGNAFVRFAGDSVRIAKNAAIDHPLRSVATIAMWATFVNAMSKWSGESEEDKKTREDRFGAPKIPFTNISLEVQTPWGAVNVARFLPYYQLNEVGGELSRFLPIQQMPVDYENGKFSVRPESFQDPLLGQVGQLITDTDFRGKKISDPENNTYAKGVAGSDKYTPLDAVSQNLNRARFLATQNIPMGREADAIISAATGNPDVYGKVRTLPQALGRSMGVKVEQFGPEQAQKQRDTNKYFNGNVARVDEYIKQNPNDAQDYYAYNSPTRDRNTNTKTSNLVTPERWNIVRSNYERGGKLYEFLKSEAYQQNKENGRPIDPIFTLPPDKVREVLDIRTGKTGDKIEREEILRATTDWYAPYEKSESDYYKASKAFWDKQAKEGGPKQNPRVEAYYNIEYPEQPQIIKDYYALKAKDPNAAKQYYKNNVNELSPAFEKYRSDRLGYINAKRAIEGAPPIDAKVFNNVTFGYEDDESKVFKELGFKLGEFGSGSSSKEYNAYRKAKSFSQPTIRIAAPKPGALKVPKPNVKKANYKVPKIVVRRSKA